MASRPLTPDTLLHIYYLEGSIANEDGIVNDYLGTWEEEGSVFVFFLEPAERSIGRLLEANPGLRLMESYEMRYEQWQGGILELVEIGGFLLVPPGCEPPQDSPAAPIFLDPGVVFGNGLHPTTRDCLRAIETACAGGRVQTMLDLGTGTGILALAAARLGCRRVIAVDNNRLACRTARANVVANHLQQRIVVVHGKAEPFTAVAGDLLVANIHYPIMAEIIASPGFLRQQWFVLSGLLRSEAARVEEHLAKLPVQVLRRWQREGIWHTFLGTTVC